MSKNKKIGITLILLPPLLFIGSLIGYSITNTAISQQLSVSPSSTDLSNFAVVRAVLGLVGLLGVVGFFTLLPLGVFFLLRKSKDEKPKGLV